MFSGRTTDKLVFTAIYITLALVVIWGARSIVNFALDSSFFRDYLLPWEVRLVALQYQQPVWPGNKEHDPMNYMLSLVRKMRTKGIQPPQSNTEHAFIYRLNKFGEKSRRILLVYRDGKIIIYGLPESTFNRLDRFIDGQLDPQDGVFTGRWSTDRITRIGQWKI